MPDPDALERSATELMHAATDLARSQPARESSRSPRTAPPQAITDCTRATERALPNPFPAGICARRQATLFPSRTLTAVTVDAGALLLAALAA